MGNHDGEEEPLLAGRSGAQREYLYFEDLSAFGQRAIPRLRIDTWYLDLADLAVGALDLGTAPIPAVPQAEFVAQVWAEALAALAPVYRPAGPISIGAWSPPWADGAAGRRISEQYAPEDLAASPADPGQDPGRRGHRISEELDPAWTRRWPR